MVCGRKKIDSISNSARIQKCRYFFIVDHRVMLTLVVRVVVVVIDAAGVAVVLDSTVDRSFH